MGTTDIGDRFGLTRREFISTIGLFTITLTVPSIFWACSAPASDSARSIVPSSPIRTSLNLSEPSFEGETPLEDTLLKRRSRRNYTKSPLTQEQISQILWAAQGITAEWGGRTAPSAGGLYPLEIYLAVGDVTNIPAGVYLYLPQSHALAEIRDVEVREQLMEAGLDQAWIGEAAANIVVAAVYERTTKKYGDRGIRYVHMEAGHAAQNIYLQAEALDLGTVTIGAFHDDQVKAVIGMRDDEVPLYIIPVGNNQ